MYSDLHIREEIHDLLDNDAISDEEAAFMLGYYS
jgi:hypothetical protein